MGVRFLNSYLLKMCPIESGAIKKQTFRSLTNKIVAVDISIYIYKMEENGNLMDNMTNMLKMFKHYNITPIFVFDGKPPAEKLPLLEHRKFEKKHARDSYTLLYNSYMEFLTTNHDSTAEFVIPNNILTYYNTSSSTFSVHKTLDRLRKDSTIITMEQIRAVKRLILHFGYTFLVAASEADELCASLVHQNIAWACISDDMDMFVYGCPRTIRCFHIKNQSFMLYTMDNILAALNITQENLRYMCIICGTDYNFNSHVNISNDSQHNHFNRVTTNYHTWNITDHNKQNPFIEHISNVMPINKQKIDHIYSMYDLDNKPKITLPNLLTCH